MIDFTIDTADLSAEFNLSQDDVDALLERSVKAVTVKFAQHWDTVAKNNLSQTKGIYRSAIQIGSQGRFTGIAYLNPANFLANWIEMGRGPYDLKPGLLSGASVKQGKNGPYTTVPFQFAMSTSIGENEKFSGVMPKEVEKAVVKKQSSPQGNKRGLSLKDIPQKYHIPKSASLRKRMKETRFDEVAAKNENQDMTSVYEGLKRNAKGSGYVNFRRVSLNSDPESWIHPGFQAKDFASRALSMLDIDHEVDMAIDGYLNELGF